MKTPPAPPLRILLMEDDQPTTEAFVADLEKIHPDAQIDTAATPVEASKLLTQAMAEKFFYDAAVLDFQVPQTRIGENTSPDFTVRSELLERSQGTIIIQVTSYGDNPEIDRFRKNRRPNSEDYPSFITKQKEDWIPMVFNAMQRGLHARRIRRRIQDLAGSIDPQRETYASRTPDYLRESPGGPSGGGTLVSDAARSLAIADLCADASQHWSFLSCNLQEVLKAKLGFAEIDGIPYLGVAPEASDEVDLDPENEHS